MKKVLTMQDVRDLHVARAHRRFLKMSKARNQRGWMHFDPKTVIHFRMLDYYISRRHKFRHKCMVRSIGIGKMRGLWQWRLDNLHAHFYGFERII
jgi:hypothetical protein